MKRIAYLFLTVLLLGGCALPVHTRELEQLQVIQTLGCDGAPGAVTVSVSSGPDPSGEAPLRLAAEGRSLTKALETLQDASPREELFFAHTRFAVIGEAAARAGLAPLLDHFERSTQTPLTVPLFVVRGGEARQLLTGSEDPAYEATALAHGPAEAKAAYLAAGTQFGFADPEGAIATSSAVAQITAADANEAIPAVELDRAELGDGIGLLALMVKAGLCASNGDARRLVTGGGCYIGEERIADPKRTVTAADFPANGEIMLRAGKKTRKRIVLK